jgi:hypothetical protein
MLSILYSWSFGDGGTPPMDKIVGRHLHQLVEFLQAGRGSPIFFVLVQFSIFWALKHKKLDVKN